MKTTFVVHKEGSPDTILLTASGRIATEPFDMPDWAASGLALAMLAEREQFYKTRLGPTATEMLATNVINYDDLSWVAVDEAGDEIEVPASDEYRQGVLATALGMDRETGDIERVITDHYIDRVGDVYTAEEIISKSDAQAQLKKANG